MGKEKPLAMRGFPFSFVVESIELMLCLRGLPLLCPLFSERGRKLSSLPLDLHGPNVRILPELISLLPARGKRVNVLSHALRDLEFRAACTFLGGNTGLLNVGQVGRLRL